MKIGSDKDMSVLFYSTQILDSENLADTSKKTKRKILWVIAVFMQGPLKKMDGITLNRPASGSFGENLEDGQK